MDALRLLWNLTRGLDEKVSPAEQGSLPAKTNRRGLTEGWWRWHGTTALKTQPVHLAGFRRGPFVLDPFVGGTRCCEENPAKQAS